MAKYRLVTTLSNGSQFNSDTFEIDDATIEVGTTETLAAGEKAYVKNAGDAHNAVLNFGIPAGAAGKDGTDGKDGTNGTDGKDGSGPQYYQHYVLVELSTSCSLGGGCFGFSFISTSSTKVTTWDEIWNIMYSLSGSNSSGSSYRYIPASGYYGATGGSATRTPIFMVWAGITSSVNQVYILSYFNNGSRNTVTINEDDVYTCYDAVLTIT